MLLSSSRQSLWSVGVERRQLPPQRRSFLPAEQPQLTRKAVRQAAHVAAAINDRNQQTDSSSPSSMEEVAVNNRNDRLRDLVDKMTGTNLDNLEEIERPDAPASDGESDHHTHHHKRKHDKHPDDAARQKEIARQSIHRWREQMRFERGYHPESKRLVQFEGIDNFRDFSGALKGKIAPGKLFRSGNPGGATDADIQRLMYDFRIMELCSLLVEQLDLRNPEEIKDDAKFVSGELFKYFHLMVFSKDRFGSEGIHPDLKLEDIYKPMHEPFYRFGRRRKQRRSFEEQEVQLNLPEPVRRVVSVTDINDSGYGTDDSINSAVERLPPPQNPYRKDGARIRHAVSMLDKAKYTQGMMKRLSVRKLALSGLYYLYSEQKAKSVVLEEVNKGGLTLLNELIVDTAKTEVCAALRVVCSALERNNPLLLYCKAGKDRTGFTSMLILSILGASDEEILADYTLSNESEAAWKTDHTGGGPKVEGLDMAGFTGAPPQVMQNTLQYMRKQYGSVMGYLDAIGFNSSWRERLRKNLLKS